MIFAGRLNTIVAFQSVASDTDTMGAPTETWAAMANVPTRAEYIPLRGDENIEAGKLAAREKFKLRIRRTATITPGVRVVIGGTTAEIRAVEDDKLNKTDMILWCEGIDV